MQQIVLLSWIFLTYDLMAALSKVIKSNLSFSYAHSFPTRFFKKKKEKTEPKASQFKLILTPKVELIVLANNLSWH